jgi:hypothetical protein
MDDPTPRCENDTGILDAPSGAPGPKRGALFLGASASAEVGRVVSPDWLMQIWDELPAVVVHEAGMKASATFTTMFRDETWRLRLR